jgi:hypothetical protein
MGQTDHAAKLHELPDEYLSDVLPIAKKIAVAQGIENYNIMQVRSAALPLTYHVLTMLPLPQNNGRNAHQVCLFALISLDVV